MGRITRRPAVPDGIFHTRANRRRRGGLLARDERGGVLLYVALMLPVLMGFAGLAVDVTGWYSDKRLAQVIVDAATLGAASELGRSATQGMTAAETSGLVFAAGNENAVLNGYDAGSGETLTINWPPASGPFTGDINFVEGVYSLPAATWFSRFFLGNTFDVAARAVATLSSDGMACVYALDEEARLGVKITGNADLDINCTIFSNSPFDQGGSSCLVTAGVYAMGGVEWTCVTGPDPVEIAAPVADPLYNFIDEDEILGDAPGHDGLYGDDCLVSGDTIFEGGDTDNRIRIAAGTYCGNVTIHGVVDFEPGFYKVDGGKLAFNAQSDSVVTYEDGSEGPISFYLDSHHKNDIIHINGGAIIDFRGHTIDQVPEGYEGMTGVLFMQNRDADPKSKHIFNGTSTVNLDGIIYTAAAEVQYNGTSDLLISNIMIVANTLVFNGTTEFATAADGTADGNPAFNIGSKLVE